MKVNDGLEVGEMLDSAVQYYEPVAAKFMGAIHREDDPQIGRSMIAGHDWTTRLRNVLIFRAATLGRAAFPKAVHRMSKEVE